MRCVCVIRRAFQFDRHSTANQSFIDWYFLPQNIDEKSLEWNSSPESYTYHLEARHKTFSYAILRPIKYVTSNSANNKILLSLALRALVKDFNEVVKANKCREEMKIRNLNQWKIDCENLIHTFNHQTDKAFGFVSRKFFHNFSWVFQKRLQPESSANPRHQSPEIVLFILLYQMFDKHLVMAWCERKEKSFTNSFSAFVERLMNEKGFITFESKYYC